MHYTKSTSKNTTLTNSATARIAHESLSSSSSNYALMNSSSPRTSLHLARGSSSAADAVQRIRDEMMRIDLTKAMNCGPHQPFTI
ncbi:hypothetical protein DFQ27_008622 [Actinomortierella ambigua]|uniref:Uncharacterized protein n=1 Tax=Actinomortierella ambigua TaxID=1343610 RepID=A0A9P6QFN8_9FUNG|nr:hypothetical protein DFQ27_008622 [Actinomortierella ambigua]